MIAKSRQRPLETDIILFFVLILNKFVILLIYRVICKVHIAIVLVELCRIRFWGKSSKTFLKYIYPQRFVWSDHYINSQVKFMTIDEQWVGYVTRDNRHLVNIELIQIFNQMDTPSTRWVGWLNDPHVTLRLCLFELLVMRVEVVEFIRKYIGIWDKIKLTSSKSLLHFYIIETKTVLSCDFIALREMINPLELVESFI